MRRITALFCLISFFFLFSLKIFSQSANVYYKHCNGEMNIALTFDDGPHPIKTPKILDILKKYNVIATFFTIGQNIEYYPESAKRIQAEGHEIGNHTQTHPHLQKAENGIIRDELELCERSIRNVLGYKTIVFRPPEGVIDEDVKKIASDMGYSVILWSVDTRDWALTPTDKIVSSVLESVRPGDIILMHDYTGKNCHTIEALDILIPKLLEQGYNFLTVSELISKQ